MLGQFEDSFLKPKLGSWSGKRFFEATESGVKNKANKFRYIQKQRYMAQFQIKRLLSGGIITNYFCTSGCRHCLYNCGPHWGKKYMDPATAEDHLRLVRSLGCRSVHIGGGEPLLRPDNLGEILEVAGRVGVSIEYVGTNSSWFKDLESAKRILVGYPSLIPENFI